MSLTPGTRLGPYELLTPIGAGGMGEVYRAKDTRLGRTVAIKVLPADTATDTAARARFEREARAIAALSHPHICVVHDVGREGDTDFLVMELLDGETLLERLARAKGPLPLPEVLTIGVAIADALDKAHRAGIVHRDLKPANVMLTKSGPKLLDFGLAKVHAGAGVSGGSGGVVALPDAETASTLAPGTAHGTILGTLHYMAPEQVEGREADARADIWALGALLYEMATGTRPFDGDSAASVLGAILKDTPAQLSTRQPLTPPAFEHLVERCLEKDPDERWQSVRDVKRELLWVATGGSATGQSVVANAPARPPTTPRIAVALLSVALLALAWPAARHVSERPAPRPPETRLEVGTPATNDRTSFALSPDGRQLVFVAEGDGSPRLWLRLLDTSVAQPLVGTEGATSPFWSPDSRAVGFFAEGQLKRLDLGSGTPHTVAPAVNSRGGTWNQNGVILFSAGTGVAVSRVSAAGGEPTSVTTLDRQSSHRYPFFLPDGNHFIYLAQGSSERSGIFLASLDSGESTRLTAADTAAVYLDPGWLLWQRDGALVAQRLDLEAERLIGDAVMLASTVASDLGGIAGGRSSASTSLSGLVAYRAGGTSRRQLTWFDRTGKALSTLGAPDESGLRSPSLSPDGRRVAVTRAAQGNTDIWLMDDDRSGRFTFDEALDRFPVWSPDGEWVAFDSNRLGQRDLYRRASGGAGADELLFASAETKMPQSWTPDGRSLLFVSSGTQSSSDLWVLPMGGDRVPVPFLKSRFRETQGRFSPDGRYVAYQSDESGRAEIYIRPFTHGDTTSRSSAADAPGSTRQWQVSTSGGISPAWRPDGKELYYLSPNGTLMAAAIDATASTIAPRSPVALFPTHVYGGGVDGGQGVQYNVTGDGRFLINTELDTIAPPITILQNWNPEAVR